MTMIHIVCVLATAAAPADASDGSPRLVRVSTVAPDVVAVTIEVGKVVYGTQRPYRHQDGDVTRTQGPHRLVLRDGKDLGALAGADAKILHTWDRTAGVPADSAWMDDPGSYRITCADDPNYAGGTGPKAAYRKTKPTDLARVAPGRFEAPLRHDLYLRLPKPLEAGREYTVACGSALAPRAFTYDPASLRSQAVHVSHLGFRPDDPAKVAFLSAWMGSGGPLTYPKGLTFRVLDHASGQSVFEGKTHLSKSRTARDEDAYSNNHNGTDVWEMDFTGVTRPGTYRVSVAGVGCSYPFRIAEDVWRKGFLVSARGFYHQRSGIELGPPYTTFRRPRSFHPDDGVKVYASTTPIMDTRNGLDKEETNFANLVKGKTDKLVADAWGGYMDAGDWDRRIQHLDVSRLLLELAELFPEYFANVSLNIPESGGRLPDIVDEALFNIDCYRRMQTPEGGIRGGIESSEHPRLGEASWQESLTIMAYAPGVWSSYIYAGVAARAAGVLETMDRSLAGVYRKSAVAAMTWAERRLKELSGKKLPHQVGDERNLAAAELFRLTGEKRYHKLFVETTAMTSAGAELFKWQHHDQPHGPWVYLRTNRPGMDPNTRENCRRAVLACQTGAGANPLNLCYTTGLGHASPRHTLHVDSRITKQGPPPGLTPLGPLDHGKQKQQWAENFIAPFCHPKRDEWPIIETFWDVFWYPMVCEFSVHIPMARNAYTWGYLAARKPLGASDK